MSVSDEALIDGVADAALEGAQRFFAGLPFGLLAEVVGAPGRVVADLGDGGHVDGVVQLSVPAGFSRCRLFGPDDASIGAVPLWRAKCPEVGNRRTSPTRPTMIAAVNGPIPYTSVTVVFDASMRRDVTLADLDTGGVEGADLVEQLTCGGDPLDRDRPVDVHAGQEFLGSGDGQRAAGATLDEQAQQGVQPADRAGPLGGDLMVAIGQQPQHDPMLIIGRDDVQRRCAPRHDRRRTGVVGVGLVDPAPLEQPHPRRQLGWHIDHMLTGADELLGEHRPHPRRPFDRPRARLEPCRPLQQPASLMPISVDTDRVNDRSRNGRRRPRCGTPCAGRSR